MDWEDDLYEQDPPEWVERSDDYNVFEERQLDLDRDAGEGAPDIDPVAERLEAIVAGALAHREYDTEPPIWENVVSEVVLALQAAGVAFDDYEVTFPH